MRKKTKAYTSIKGTAVVSGYREQAVIIPDPPRRQVKCKDCCWFAGLQACYKFRDWDRYKEGQDFACIAKSVSTAVGLVRVNKDNYGLIINSFDSCNELNKHNDCNLYRRKWWKFWRPR